MADLSYAAQAVLTAITQDQYGLNPADVPNEAARFSSVAAAALRAAAKQLGPKSRVEPGYIFSASAIQQWHYEFQLEAERKLLAIATELENADD